MSSDTKASVHLEKNKPKHSKSRMQGRDTLGDSEIQMDPDTKAESSISQVDLRIEGKEEREEKSLKEFCFAVSIIVVLFSLIGGNFLQYAHSIFTSRLDGSSTKRTDQVINVLFLLSVISSMLAGAVMTPEARNARKQVRRLKKEVRGDRSADLSSVSSTERGFIELKIYIIMAQQCMVFSFTFLLTGLFVLAWSELGRAVSITVTVAFSAALLLLTLAHYSLKNSVLNA